MAARFQIEFAWTGTADPAAYLSVPEAIRYLGSLLPNGWSDIRYRNHQLAVAARKILCEALNVSLPCPDSMLGTLASIPIPDAKATTLPKSPLYADPLQEELRRKDGIELPLIPWPKPPKRLLRVSSQLYNSLPQYQRLGEALTRELRK